MNQIIIDNLLFAIIILSSILTGILLEKEIHFQNKLEKYKNIKPFKNYDHG